MLNEDFIPSKFFCDLIIYKKLNELIAPRASVSCPDAAAAAAIHYGKYPPEIRGNRHSVSNSETC